MISIVRTDSTNPDFINLVKSLDAYLAEIDGDLHAFYNQFNKVAHLKYVVLAYEKDTPLGCGAIKEYEPGVMEVKRMYVTPESRGKGIATKILRELENWARELSATACILETGFKQQDAIELYKKNGYTAIPNYGQYAAVEESRCFQKNL